jgi:hypothetical protein
MNSNNYQRVLLIGVTPLQKARLKWIVNIYTLLMNNPATTICSRASDLERAVLGTNIPEDKTTFHIPEYVFFTGHIIGYDGDLLYLPFKIPETIKSIVPANFEHPFLEHIKMPKIP